MHTRPAAKHTSKLHRNPPNSYSLLIHLSPWGEILMLILWLGKCALSLCFIRLNTVIWHVIGEGIWFITATLHFLLIHGLFQAQLTIIKWHQALFRQMILSQICVTYTPILCLCQHSLPIDHLQNCNFKVRSICSWSSWSWSSYSTSIISGQNLTEALWSCH